MFPPELGRASLHQPTCAFDRTVCSIDGTPWPCSEVSAAAGEPVRAEQPKSLVTEVLEWTKGLIGDTLRVQREGCDHKGIGQPGCGTCDPRIFRWRETLAAYERLAALAVPADPRFPPGPYTLVWPSEQGGMFTIWGKVGTPPDFKDGWAIPIVASGVQTAMEALLEVLNRGGLDRIVALEKALDSIIIRCDEGDPRSDWLPTISGIAKEALGR